MGRMVGGVIVGILFLFSISSISDDSRTSRHRQNVQGDFARVFRSAGEGLKNRILRVVLE